jgi:DNA-binding GntR family transcriptional regulator
MEASQPILNPIHNTPSLQDLAYASIKEGILTLGFLPGVQLSEAELAEQLQVSKTPVREALKRLEQEGLVHIVPRRGVFVTEISVLDIREISEVRGTLIGLAAEYAARTVSDADLEEARAILEAGDLALEQGNDEQWLKENEQFHNWLMSKADNKRLRRLLANLDEQFQRVQRLAASMPGGLVDSNQEHYDILRAISSRDPEIAASTARQHVEKVGERSIRKLTPEKE